MDNFIAESIEPSQPSISSSDFMADPTTPLWDCDTWMESPTIQVFREHMLSTFGPKCVEELFHTEDGEPYIRWKADGRLFLLSWDTISGFVLDELEAAY